MENTQSTLQSALPPKRTDAGTIPKSAAEQQRRVQGKAEKPRHRNPSQAHANTLGTETPLDATTLAQGRNMDAGTEYTPYPQQLKGDKVDLKEQLRRAQSSLEQLQKAIPPLPEPHQLFDKIVSLCFDNFIHTKATTALEEKTRRVRISNKPALIFEVDNLRMKFLFCRYQLRILYSIPPLLIAMQKMTLEFWETITSQPQETSEGNPLLTDMETIENVVSDHLQTLSTLQSTLVEVRMEAQNEMDKKTSSFENEVRDKLEGIQKTMEGLQNTASHNSQALAAIALRSRGEGIPRIQEEKEIIKNNESDREESDMSDIEDQLPNREHRGRHDDADYEANAEDEAFEENVMRHQIPEVDVSRRNTFDIDREIRNTEQELRDFEAILRQYENELLCPPRRYGQGNISKANERYMKCVFCDIVGHYSDSCPEVRDPYARREIIIRNDRCGMCLEKICPRGASCKKYLTACYYCRDRGHHSGLCTFPDRSDYIRSRLENAQQGRIRSLNRLNDLRRERARHGFHL
ncbi:hypothetical protein OSTOST_15422 [Ostertagia ostertagi]